MPVTIDKVDMELEVLPEPPARDERRGPGDDVWHVLRSSAFRAALRPIVVEIITEELERLRRRLG